jgi:nitronate monooxygenase
MWNRNPFTERFGLEHPIVQGPFGGGNSSVALVVAVSEAGALGSLGAVNLSPDEIRDTVGAIHARTRRPFNINLWLPVAGQDDAAVSAADVARSVARVADGLRALGLPTPAMPERFAWSFDALIGPLLDAAPPVVSFVMGVPDRAVIRDAARRGIRTIGTATTVDEAVAIEAAGIDAVVASGADAGGHRGSFLRPVEASLVGTMSLVPQVARAVRIPVIAAGGIADGRGIAASLALGAQAVQVGTAFLATPESGAPEAHKRVLGTPEARWTRLTRAITGRHARGVDNELMRTLEAHLADVLPYPAQSWVTGALRRAAGAAGADAWLALWAGQNASSARPMPAADLVRRLVDETDDVLRAPHLRPRTP